MCPGVLNLSLTCDFPQAIKMLIAAGVKELEGRVSSGRISFAGSDGEGIWHDFDNVEKDLAGNLEEMSLDEEALDGDKENKPCVAVRESCWVKEREDEGEKSWEGVPLALRLASQPCETLPVEEASSAYVDLPVEFCWGEDELYD
ncbi:hypothetical protein QBC41DRAFT_222040 [Cercophora samala]|uniref:Uncharacterized protein n=1 Tax=Cercophora samala TaxID=330535 RepID=A0AA39ZFZ3_9PEZI|nr:hypothetical protein QBC41DRAFT_222040 [Cercophora samala]